MGVNSYRFLRILAFYHFIYLWNVAYICLGGNGMIRAVIITWLVDRCLNMIESELLDAFDIESSVNLSNMVVGRSYRIQFTSRFVRYLKHIIASSFGYIFMRGMFDRINSSDVYIIKLTDIKMDHRDVTHIRGNLYVGGDMIDRNFIILPKSLRYVAEL